jgi:hypothetical protein
MKYRKYQILIMLLLSFCIHVVNGQSNEREGEERIDTIINLLQSLDSDGTIILLENDNYIVKTTLNLFKENLNNWIQQHPRLEVDKKLLEVINLQSKKDIEVNAEKIAKRNDLEERLEFRIADMLENGKCLIFNKKKKKILTEVKFQTYSYYCGELCGDGGRRFFDNDFLLFQTEDWIS